MKDFEDMIKKASVQRGVGPYALQDAVDKFHRNLSLGLTPYHCYLSAINMLDVSASRIDARKPDTAPRTWCDEKSEAGTRSEKHTTSGHLARGL